MSNADKRTFSTDALATLGTIIGPDEKRDAIHLGVIPVECGVGFLTAGDHVALVNGRAKLAQMGKDDGIGIVDPFLNEAVECGEWFWLVIYPRVITSLRHVWTHPELPDEPSLPFAASEPLPAVIVASPEQKLSAEEFSEQWLRDWIGKADCPSYEMVMKAIAGESISHDDFDASYSWENWGDGLSLFFRNVDAHDEIPPEFWDHVEIVTGKKIPKDERAVSFSCGC